MILNYMKIKKTLNYKVLIINLLFRFRFPPILRKQFSFIRMNGSELLLTQQSGSFAKDISRASYD